MASMSPRSVLKAAESQWLFTLEDFAYTPSAVDGMPLRQERENRGKGVNFITQVGIMLKLPQMTLSTANIFLHRFFMRYSMVDKPGRPGMHYYAIAATAILLATKVEENCRKMRDLVIACCRTAQKNPNLVVDEQSKEYWRWRDTILHNEDVLLEALCFDLSHEPPYKTFFDFLNRLGEQHNKNLRNSGWTFLNDSSVTMLCLLYPSRVIAAAALYCSARHHGYAFADHGNLAWWEVLDVSLLDIKKACNYMASVYEENPSKHGDSMYIRTPEDDDPLTAKTRAGLPLISASPTPSPRTQTDQEYRSEQRPQDQRDVQGRQSHRDELDHTKQQFDQQNHESPHDHPGQISSQGTQNLHNGRSSSPRKRARDDDDHNGYDIAETASRNGIVHAPDLDRTPLDSKRRSGDGTFSVPGAKRQKIEDLCHSRSPKTALSSPAPQPGETLADSSADDVKEEGEVDA